VNSTDDDDAFTAGQHTVLLAEDEEMVRDLLEQVLTDAGYSVLVARDGEEALELGLQHAGVIELFVSDVRMPRLDGVSAADRLTLKIPKLKVLLMSGCDADRGGAYTFLPKPLMPAELLEAVGAILAKS
jgi:DNA-binding NtrC family response regulator